MDFEFPPDALMLQDMLRRFIQKEARPLEMKYFNEGSLSQEERDRLRRAIEQLGLWGLTVPEEYGGGGLDLVTTCSYPLKLERSLPCSMPVLENRCLGYWSLL
jgi:acyl-CoA dehydrogenase